MISLKKTPDHRIEFKTKFCSIIYFKMLKLQLSCVGFMLLMLYMTVTVSGRNSNTNIVLTKDTLVLNENGRRHSNNIVIKDSHHKDCKQHHHHYILHPIHHDHETHHHYEHHGGHHEESDHGHHHQHQGHHHRSMEDDMLLASQPQQRLVTQPIESNHQSTDLSKSSPQNADWSTLNPRLADTPAFESNVSNFLPGVGNSALNHILGLRYFRPLNVARSELQRSFKLPVFVHDQDHK